MSGNTIIQIYNNLLYSAAFISTVVAFIATIIAYKKLRNTLIKYTIFILIPALAILFSEQVFMMLSLFLGDIPEIIFARALTSYIIYSYTIYSHLYFFHKVIGEPFGLLKKIIAGSLTLINMLDFIRKTLSDDLWNRDVTTIIMTTGLIYLIYIYYKNREKITIPILKVFYKTYSIAGICYIVWAYSGLAVSFWLPEYYFILEAFNVFLLVQIIFHAFVGIIMIKFILKPPFSMSSEDVINSFKDKYKLSKQEIKVTNLLVQGLSSKEMSEQLFVSAQTIKNYTSRVYKKIGIKNKFELISMINQHKA